jgi:hypothetical protein
MQQWHVDRVTPISPTDAAKCDAAYLLRLSCGDETTEGVVEFASPSSVASGGYAEEKFSAFLSDDEPPRRILVERDGAVQVVDGPRAVDPDRPPRVARPAEPQRARRRSRR